MPVDALATHHVSTVIPTYNGRHLLQRHLHHVLKALRDQDEVLIVDDHSTDDTLSWLKVTFKLKSVASSPLLESFPSFYYPNMRSLTFQVLYGKAPAGHGWARVVVIALARNSRFAAAANVGVALASYPHILLLNNDVSPRSDIISHLLPHFESENVFGVGCLEYNVDVVTDDDIAGNSKSAVVQNGKPSGKNKLWFHRGLFVHERAEEQTSGQTAWVSGGSGMFARKTWIALGGFDKRFYPAYWEDIDLSFRARQMGLAVLFEENAVVFHQHEATNSAVFGKKKIESMSWRNAHAFVRKNGTFLQKLQFCMWQPYWWWKRMSRAGTDA